MSLAEVIRAIESKKRQQHMQAQEKATFDYILADLVGRSISRVYSSTAHMPQLHEAYPTLFDSEEMEEKRQIKQDEISAIRFKQFAEAFNKRKKEVNNGE